MKPDPRRRPDNTCAVCRKPLPKRPEKAYASVEQFARDPFCSRTCAASYHGVKERANLLTGSSV